MKNLAALVFPPIAIITNIFDRGLFRMQIKIVVQILIWSIQSKNQYYENETESF